MHLAAAKIEVAIGEAFFLGDGLVLIRGERRRGGGAEDFQVLDADFDFAGGDFLVDEIGAAGGDLAGDADDPFGAELAGFFVKGFAAGVGVEDELGEAVAVAEVDEDETAVVAIGMDPAGELDGFADVGAAELAAGVGAIARLDGLHGRNLLEIEWAKLFGRKRESNGKDQARPGQDCA